VVVLATLVIAGTGAYVVARVIGVGALGSALAGTVYELGGPFFGWLGWPVAAVMSWAPWLVAATVVILRGRRRLAGVTWFAVVLALAVYAGQPDALVPLGAGVVVFVAAALAQRSAAFGGGGPVRRPLGDLALAAVGGVALGAPLLLPGIQLTTGAIRTTKASTPGLPPHDLLAVAVAGFDGFPWAGSRWFGALSGNGSYQEAALYLGVVALVLAVTAVAVHREGATARALAAVAVVSTVLVFAPGLPGLDVVPGAVRWHRSDILLALAVAVLAGMGGDAVAHAWRAARTRAWLAGGFAAGAVVLGATWLLADGGLSPADHTIRTQSLAWPAASVAVGLVVAGGAALGARRPSLAPGSGDAPARRWGAGLVVALLACETGFLVWAGAPLWSSTDTFFPSTAAVTALQRAAGDALVGFGARACSVPPDLGVPQDANVAYGVHEFDVYDPVTPKALFRSWEDATGQPAGLGNPVSVFCPVVTSAAEARRYGVGVILVPAGSPRPPGTVFLARVDDAALYRVPGAAPATVTAAPSPSAPASSRGPARALAVTHPDPATWRMALDEAAPAVVQLHLLSVPGWHATLDGRPLPLRRTGGALLEATVPAGRHVLELGYWPVSFTWGLAIAGAGVLGLAAAGGRSVRRRRRRAGGAGG
ncbi:MAG TPA: hypothetical protein VLZ77_04910, partial [Acidimicrobiales bacterium]|nr:hypothetical protein [Acidimicrobiales bacterium]